MLDRLDSALARARNEGRTAVAPYVTIGFPSIEDTLAIVPAIEQAGADAIELGVPYSDPLADGPVIQAASYRALTGGVDTHACIEAVRDLRAAGVSLPLIFMGYYNPILRYGIPEYAADCADAGVDALIIPDLPPDEAGELREAVEERGLGLVAMLAPTSTEERIELGCERARGFVYCVSVTGVTGARSDLPDDLPEFVARVRRHTELPVAVGFGIAERRHVERVGQVADVAAVGSALINVIDSAPPGEAASRAGAFVRGLTAAG
ncbi:MAG: tryptophan synthase subunit alpha [Chloroflexi bacterium]|nr:tryptophan synthase subunit alpha [Chloroflexota bacterium]